MKRITTAILCVALMVLGIAAAFHDFKMSQNTISASPTPLEWKMPTTMPLDLQLDLEKRQTHAPSIKDSVNIIDSVRIVEKTKWKVRYKNVAARTTAREAGKHLTPVTPDSMSMNPARIGTQTREEKICETVDTSKVSSVRLLVDGQVVYDSENDNHSTEGASK